MAVELLGEVYRCNICGNEVRVIKVGGGTLVCCGEDMEQIDEISHSAANLPDTGGSATTSLQITLTYRQKRTELKSKSL